MIDRDLLELAAKAAGLKIAAHPNWEGAKNLIFISGGANWNPLTDDGDALRLAVKLLLEIDIALTGIAVRTPRGGKALVDVDEEPDIYAATRRAIARAAAEIGKAGAA